MGLGIGTIGNFLLGGLDLLTLGPMRSVCAQAGRPVFVNLNNQYETQREKVLKGQKLEKPGFLDHIKNGFAWGDVASIFGLIGWIVSWKFLQPQVDEQGTPKSITFFQKALSWGVKILTFGGFSLARLGQWKGIPMKHILGDDKYSEYFINKIENETGKKVFEEMDVNKLIEDYLNSNQEYNENIRGFMGSCGSSGIDNGNFSGFLTGPSGTGKTSGVMYLCGRWAKALIENEKAKGKQAVIKIKRFDFNGIERYTKGQSEAVDRLAGAADRVGPEAGEVARAFKHNPLDLIDMILTKINLEREKAKKNGEHLVIILDEVDKIFPLDDLEGVRKSELKDLIIKFQEIISEKKGNIWLTSNEDVDYFQKIPCEKTITEGLRGRLDNLRKFIDLPDRDTQSRIVANYLLVLTKQLNELNPKLFGDLDQIFDPQIVRLIKNRKKHEQRRLLSAKIYSKIYANKGCNIRLSGRNILTAIEEQLRDRVTTKDNDDSMKRKDNLNRTKITFQILREVLQNFSDGLFANKKR